MARHPRSPAGAQGAFDFSGPVRPAQPAPAGVSDQARHNRPSPEQPAPRRRSAVRAAKGTSVGQRCPTDGLRPEPPLARSDVTGGPLCGNEAHRVVTGRSIVYTGVAFARAMACRACVDREGAIKLLGRFGGFARYLWQPGTIDCGIIGAKVEARCAVCGARFEHEKE